MSQSRCSFKWTQSMGISRKTLALWNRQRDFALGMGSDPLNRSRHPPAFKRRCLGGVCRRASDALRAVLPQASPQCRDWAKAMEGRLGPRCACIDPIETGQRLTLGFTIQSFEAMRATQRQPAETIRNAHWVSSNTWFWASPRRSGRSFVRNPKQNRGGTTLVPTASVQ